MTPALRAKLTRRLGAEVVAASPVAGGDINTSFSVALADGRRVFVKTHARPLPAMYLHEAEGLRWLDEAKSLRVPEVLDASDTDADGPAYLALTWIESAARRARFDEELGRGLARLHQRGAPCFGLPYDNYLAVLPQDNRPCEAWADFYVTRRLLPQLQHTKAKAHLPASLRARLEALCARMPELVGPEESPARLHGDLWGGNLLVDEAGGPCLIDPAVYGGHREVDLAMMRLFGGFSSRVFAAYHEASPLAQGHEARVPLYQLYPLLVHVNLFGSSYVSSVERALAALGF